MNKICCPICLKVFPCPTMKICQKKLKAWNKKAFKTWPLDSKREMHP